MRARVVLIGLAGAATATAHAGPAADPGLHWRAPASCPDAAEVRARIERRLGGPLERTVRDVVVDVTQEQAGPHSGFVARVDLPGDTIGRERRVLRSARCDELADAVALVIARIATEGRAGRADPDEPMEPPAAVAAPAPAAAPDPPRDWGGGVHAIGVSGIGAQPGVGLGGQLAVYARYRSAFAEVSAAWWSPQPIRPRGSASQADIGLALAALRLGWGPRRLPLRGWISAELGSIDGRSEALAMAIGHERWLAVGAGFRVAWPMTVRTRLIGLVELAVPLSRPRLAFSNGTPVFQAGPATPRCGFGLEVGWP